MFVYLLFVFTIFIGATYGDGVPSTKTCEEISRNDIESHLSTKTPYRAVANLNDKPPRFEDCEPRRLWSIIRHGARNPSKKVIKQAMTELMTLRDNILAVEDASLCDDHLQRFSDWKFNISAEEEKFLVAEGEDELIELAERMQNRFPSLLPKDYDPDMFYFKYTATQRTLKSAQSFATGLFGRNRIGEIIYPKPLHKDPVLRIKAMRSLLEPAGVQKNLRRILGDDLIMEYNVEGVQGKKSLKQHTIFLQFF